MPDILMIDDILAPRDTLVVKYQGRAPFTAAAIMPGMMREVMKITGKDTLETDVRWDSTGEMRQFYGKWMGKRKEDQWTATHIRIVIQGEQHAKEHTGSVVIEIKGTIRTEYEYNNFIQRAFWWFYNKTFYYNQRRQYFEFAKDNLFEIRERFQRALGIEPR